MRRRKDTEYVDPDAPDSPDSDISLDDDDNRKDKRNKKGGGKGGGKGKDANKGDPNEVDIHQIHGFYYELTPSFGVG